MYFPNVEAHVWTLTSRHTLTRKGRRFNVAMPCGCTGERSRLYKECDKQQTSAVSIEEDRDHANSPMGPTPKM